MLDILTTKKNLNDYFYYLCNLYDKKKFSNFKAIYQFYFEEEGDIYHFNVSILDGKVEYNEGIHDNPNLTIYTPLSVWFDISSKVRNGTWAYITKKYKIKGPLRYLLMFEKVFGKIFSEKEINGVNDRKKDFEIPKKRVWKKSKKVLIIEGSPRKENGHTYLYLNSFIKGIEKAGAIVEIIYIYDKKINLEPCRGCEACWVKNDRVCVIKDDIPEIIQKINNSYLTIYAFPLYIDSIPARLKALIDRYFINLLPVFVPFDKFTRHPLRNIKERYMCLFSVCGFPEIEHFNPLVKTFQDIARNFHTPLIATILRPGSQFFYRAPNCKYYLEKIFASLEQAGEDLINRGKISNKILKSISNNFAIKKDVWNNFANMYWYLKSEKYGEN